MSFTTKKECVRRPVCKNKTRLRIQADTELMNFPPQKNRAPKTVRDFVCFTHIFIVKNAKIRTLTALHLRTENYIPLCKIFSHQYQVEQINLAVGIAVGCRLVN